VVKKKKNLDFLPSCPADLSSKLSPPKRIYKTPIRFQILGAQKRDKNKLYRTPPASLTLFQPLFQPALFHLTTMPTHPERSGENPVKKR